MLGQDVTGQFCQLSFFISGRGSSGSVHLPHREEQVRLVSQGDRDLLDGLDPAGPK